MAELLLGAPTVSEIGNKHSTHALYRDIVSKLDDFLYGGETVSKDPNLEAAPTLVAALAELRLWAADIGAQDDESVLDSLDKDAPHLGVTVRNRLRATRDAIANFEALINSDGTNTIEEPRDLTLSSERISDAVTSLRGIAEDILEHRKEIVGNDLASVVRSVLDQYSKSSSNLERPEDVFDDIDNLVPLDLEYSDEESGQRRRPRFQKRKRRIMSTNRFATFVETKIMPKIRDSRAIPRKVPIRAWFPPILPNQTRLATLFPGELEDPITFSVEVVSIDRLNYYDYEAVSYAWDFSKPSDVKINMAPNHANEDLRGRGTQSLFIRPHAADALHCIRRKDTVLTVWIDSLCMDLANDEEKVAQSQNYAPIFAHARCVDVWIGKDGRIGHVNFNWIKRLVGFGSPQDLDLNASSAIRWEEFLVFMHLDIFRRSWVVQEVIIAQQVTVWRNNDQLRWDYICLRWDYICDAVMLWQRAKSTNPALASQLYERVLGSNESSLDDRQTSAERLVHARRYLNQKRAAGENISAEELILSLSWTKNSRARDAIYAFIGLAWGDAKIALTDWPWSPSNGTPLIGGSLSDKTVFMRFVARCIKQSGSLDIILRRWTPWSTAGYLPSWIQVLEMPMPVRVSFVGQPGQKKQLYNASASVYPSYQFADERASQSALTRPMKYLSRAVVLAILAELDLISHHHSLFVHGIEIGVIEELSPRISEGVVPAESLQLVAQSIPLIFDMETLCRILVADRTSTGDSVPAWYSRVIIRCVANNAGLNLSTTTDPDTPRAISEVLTRVRDVTWNRKLIRTDNNLVGLAPAETQRGDSVCVLFGCSVPVILRRRNESYPSYELIGECFVDKFMDGKAMELGANPRQFMLV